MLDERYLPPESLQPDIAVQPSPETLYHISLQFDRAPARPMVARAAVYGIAGDTGFYEVTVSSSSERCVFEIEAGEAISILPSASDADADSQPRCTAFAVACRDQRCCIASTERRSAYGHATNGACSVARTST